MMERDIPKDRIIRCGFCQRYCNFLCPLCSQEHRAVGGMDEVWYYCHYPSVLYNRPAVPLADRETVTLDTFGNIYHPDTATDEHRFSMRALK